MGSYEIKNLQGTPEDYAKKEHWLRFPEVTKEVDTFFIYPTVFGDASENAPEFVPIDHPKMHAGAEYIYGMQATVYEKYTNVFAPYYRQANLTTLDAAGGDALERVLLGIPRTDVFAALDYYFTHVNQGRPFFLAAHSQGSVIGRIVIADYMQAHPDYYERMIAAYLVGCSVTEKELADFPHMKFAESADDTGVIIAWNTEGPDNTGGILYTHSDKGIACINPLNWKRDDTYAGTEENLGSRILNPKTMQYEDFRPGIADAQIDLKRRAVICTNTDYPYTVPAEGMGVGEIFGPRSFHAMDYSFYYYNIQENVKTRMDAYRKR